MRVLAIDTALGSCSAAVLDTDRGAILASRSVPMVRGHAEALMPAWPAGAAPPLVVETSAAPDIDWVARLGAAASEPLAPPKPLYLRAPDAQPQDAARLPRR